MTEKQYGRLVKEMSPKSPMGRDCFNAFWIGGLICVLGQLLMNGYAKHAGAGTLVPITGFANSIAAPAVEFKTEGFVLGVGAKMFTIAGPVIVYGLAASVVYGFLYWLCQVL